MDLHVWPERAGGGARDKKRYRKPRALFSLLEALQTNRWRDADGAPVAAAAVADPMEDDSCLLVGADVDVDR